MTLRLRRHPELKTDHSFQQNKKIFIFLLIFLFLLILAFVFGWYHFFVHSQSMEDLGIERIYSSCDRNQNGIDDYTDMLYGAREDAENHPKYDDRYWPQGYPPKEIGVCTDVVWRAFRQAGYSLRDMVDQDIERFPEDYPNVSVRDRNIDFRRVKNLRVFFQKYAQPLPVDPDDLSSWLPGDIVIFGDDTHIGIVSDQRSRDGKAYIIHNGGQLNREENYLSIAEPTGHYRFNAAEVQDSVLISWDTDVIVE